MTFVYHVVCFWGDPNEYPACIGSFFELFYDRYVEEISMSRIVLYSYQLKLQ